MLPMVSTLPLLSRTLLPLVGRIAGVATAVGRSRRVASGKTFAEPLKFVTSSSCAPLVTRTTLPAPPLLFAWLFSC
jgi:hypothetical protein